ncbi:MAG: YeeE/YedE family protein, partial [Myxococcales bacterium]|nr:YeeE/YedE family protein [Myxococcales bacterium]
YAVASAFSKRLRRPFAASRFHPTNQRHITPRLVVGSLVFGVGWGLVGYCPGPAIASLGTLSAPAVIVVLSMIAGATATHRLGLIRPRGTGERPPVGAKAAPGAQ